MSSLIPYLQPTRYAIEQHTNDMYGFGGNSTKINSYDVGDDCSRRAWYKRRGVTGGNRSPELFRYIETNRYYRKFVIDILEAIGVKIWDQGKSIAFADHNASSKIDGLALGVKEAPNNVHLLSIRPVKQKQYADIVNKGIPDKDNKKIQIDMRLMGVNRCLYIAVNRNTDEMHIERVKLDIKFADAQISKAERIIQLKTPPARVGTDKPSWWQCKACPISEECFKD